MDAPAGGRVDKGDPASRVYIHNLPYTMTWQGLKDLMRQAGNVEYADVATDAAGRSKGWATVRFATAEEAQNAIRTLSGVDVQGRVITVREDLPVESGARGRVAGEPTTHKRPRDDRSRSGSRDRSFRRDLGSSATTSTSRATKLYINNLPFTTTWQSLKDLLRGCGEIVHVDVAVDQSGKSKGFAVAEMGSPADAANAIQRLNETMFEGRKIFIREDAEPRDRPPVARSHPPPSRYHERSGYAGAYPPPNYPTAYPAYSPYADPSSYYAPPPAKRARGRSRSRSRSPRRSHSERDDVVRVGRTVYVGNLAYSTSWQSLKDHFRKAGTVMRADVMADRDGRSKGCGIVEFSSARESMTAIQRLHDSILDGRRITVREDRE